MSADSPCFLGIDAGTGGLRALLVDFTGRVLAEASASLPAPPRATADGRHEQSPHDWWAALVDVLGTLRDCATRSGVRWANLAALAIDGTSGTLVALDRDDRPLRPALMYNDARARVEAEELCRDGAAICRKLGYRISASYAIAKIAWLRRHEPETFERATRFVHQADYLAGRLKGRADTTDYSNALKTGYDTVEERWPDWIATTLDLGDRLPRVVAPGTPVGHVTKAAADETGLPEGLLVVAGATDGTAAMLASGARQVGDDNTTLGTTLVFKRVALEPCHDPAGLIYSHKLPGGFWLPGAASNTGGEWTSALFANEDLRVLDRQADTRLPSRHAVYPLVRRGERFPVADECATGFFAAEDADRQDRYAACLQGTAFVERWAYEVLDARTGHATGAIHATGGGSRSEVWMQCRADVTGRAVHRPAVAESAFGAAVLAAAGASGEPWGDVSRRMVRIERSFVPDPARTERYDSLYEAFCETRDRHFARGSEPHTAAGMGVS